MFKHIFIIAVFILTGLSFQPAQAQTVPYGELKAQLIEHPDYLALVSQSESLNHAADGEKGLPDPEVRLGINNFPINGGGFDEFLPTNKSIGFSQRIPNFGVLDASSEEVRMRSKQSGVQAQWMLQQLEARLIITLVRLNATIKQIELVESQQELLKLEAVYWDGRLEGGESVYDERSEVDARIAALTVRKANLEAQKATYSAELEELTQKVVIDVVEIPTLNPVPWAGEVSSLYPVMMAEYEVSSTEASVDMREAAFGPNFNVGVTYQQREEGRNFSGDDWVSAGVGVTIPLWYSSNQRPKLRAAESRLSQAKSHLRMAERLWRSRLSSLNSSIIETDKALTALKDQYKAVKEKTDSLNSAYASGTADLDAVIFSEFTQADIEARVVETIALKASQIAEFNSPFGGHTNDN